MNEPRPGAIIGERFVIDALAGSGGMGAVYRARDLTTEQPVALKILHPAMQAYLDRFAREARLLAQLDHPGIVRYIAHGDRPALYLAMEWLEGEDLGQRLARAPLGVSETLAMARRAAEALDAAHRRGVIHRDIKPGNIFLCAGGAVKLLDFGVARPLFGSRVMTMSGQVLGTVGYMAPEQARDGSEVRSPLDVFSLGCVLFECLGGQPAFPGTGLMPVMAKLLFAKIPRLSDVHDGVPPPLDDLVQRMMQRKPEDRPTMPAIIAELEALASSPDLADLARRPAQRARPDARAPAIGDDEQPLIALVLARSVSGYDTSLPTVVMDSAVPNAEELARAIARFGGRADARPEGDFVVMLRDATAATDLAARAARCALTLRDRMPGVAVAVAVGRGESWRPRALDLAEHAERLLVAGTRVAPAVATRAGVWLDVATADLFDGRFDVAAGAGGLELLGFHDAGDRAWRRGGAPTPLVGRARELTMLEAALDECVTESMATALVVSGPSGAGKSRLWHEAARRLADREPPFAIWTAAADPDLPGVPFGLVARMLRRLAELDDTMPVELSRQRLAERARRHLRPADAARVAEVLGRLLEPASPLTKPVPETGVDPATSRAWEELVAAECGAGPVLMVLEDLHWGDLASVRLIDTALRALRAAPLAVIALARPEVNDAFPQLWSERRVQALRLGGLTPRAARELAAGVVGASADAAAIDAIVAAAGGNPLELEVMSRAVAAGRGGELPDAVIAIEQARLEQLPPASRRVLRAASVFGPAFWLGGVAALLGDAPRDVLASQLAELVDRELVTRRSTSRLADEEELAFRTAGVRDAAYAMLTEHDRELGHELAGAWLDAAGERDASIIAGHLERGSEPGSAVVWCLWAAEQALEGNRFPAVVRRTQRGVANGASGAVLGELLLLEAEALGWMGRYRDHARAAAEAVALLPRGGSAHARAVAELAVASCRLGEHVQLCAAAESLAATDAGPAILSATHALALARTANALATAGRRAWGAPVVAMLDGARAAFDDDEAVLATARAWLTATEQLFGGHPERHARDGAALAAALDAAGQPRSAVVVELHALIALAAIGDLDAAVAQATRTIERAGAMGLVPYVERARAHLALPLALTGRAAEGEALARACLDAAAVSGDRLTAARAGAALAEIRRRAGDRAGVETAACAVAFGPGIAPNARADAFATLVRARLDAGALEAAAAAADEALAALGTEPTLGDVALRLAIADTLAAGGATDGARRVVAETAAAVAARAASIADPALRAVFLAIPAHRALAARADGLLDQIPDSTIL